jgi:TRAP-type mannitol/chloroaromatic compound transport system permease small subunit
MERLARAIESLIEWSGRAVSWLTLAMVLITVAVVALRYLFDLGWIAMQESITALHALVFLIGAAYTLKHDAHVRVDIFYRGMSPVKQAWVDILGTLLLLLPTCVFIFWISWEYVASSFELREGSRESGGLPGVYLLKAVILAMAVMMVLQGLAMLIRNALVIAGHAGSAPEHARGEPEI